MDGKGGLTELDLKAFIKEVHEVAVCHGWWENKPSDGQLLAMIHSEWSEALDEYRNRKPLVYCKKECGVGNVECVFGCKFESYSQKPEGVAVELCDGIIRIFDLFGGKGYETAFESFEDIRNTEILMPDTFPELICALHAFTADGTFEGLECAVALCFEYLAYQSVDVEELLSAKNEYNKTRPYRHGNKVC